MSVAIDGETTDSTKDQFADAFDVEDAEQAREVSSNPSECYCDVNTWETAYPTDYC